MDTELMRTFLEVNKTRHFGRAAENLYLTQAAVSARVRQLEDILGVSLFTRARNNIQLSAEGERLVPHAETILMSWARAQQDLVLKQEHKLQLSIGTTAGLWHYALQHQLPKIQQALSNIALRAEAYTVEDLLRLVQENVLDLVVLFEPVKIPTLVAKSLGKLELVLASTDPTLSVKEAMQDNYVYVDWGTTFGLFHAKRFPDAPPKALHTNMATIAESFIVENQGCAYLPRKLLEQRNDDQLNVIKGAPTFSRDLYVVYPINSPRQQELGQLIDLLYD